MKTNDDIRTIDIPLKPSGCGSDVNGGELLRLALATCYCNDIYREAGKRGLKVDGVEVHVEGDFGSEGEPAKNIVYSARVISRASESEIRDLMQFTDQVAEIQNTLRAATPVTFSPIEIDRR